MTYLGLDLGTSGLKALLTDDDGAVIGQTAHAYPVSHRHDGWSEQDPAHWVAAVNKAVADLRASHPEFTDLRGIAVSGQMHGATLLDQSGAVLRPCILWNDTRSHAQAALLDATPAFRAISGNIVFPGFTAPKLLWVRDHEPDIFARVAKVLLPAAYLNFYLTGEYVGDLSDASGTSWLDVRARGWSDDLLAQLGMSVEQMPRLVDGCAPAGQLRRDLAQNWGLEQAAIVAGGAGDNAATACGLGLLAEGAGAVSLGSSGVVMVARNTSTPAPQTAVHTFCHALPGRWYQMGVMLAAADNLNWLANLVSLTPHALITELGENLRAPSAIRYQPYLAGERTPHNDPHLRAGFAGIGATSNRADMTQAVLEGVCFTLRENLEALRATGAAPERLYAVGGGAKSPYWIALLATVLDLPIEVSAAQASHGAALGAARLARLAATDAPIADVISPPRDTRTILPATAHRAAFEDAFATFQTAGHWSRATIASQPSPATP